MTQQQAKIYHELLILKAQAGQRDAFETLVTIWEKPFFSYARAYTNSEAAAWDILQETWLVIVRKLNTLSHPAKFKSWAFRILNHKCADHFRRASSDRRLKQAVARTAREPDDPPGEQQALQQALLRLTADQRTLILLRFNQTMSILEIARTLNVPEGTVKSRLHRTLNELKTYLNREIDDD